MLEVTLPAQKAGRPSLHDLAARCVEYHADVENYFDVIAIEYALLRRLRIDPHSRLGRLAAAVMTFTVALLPAWVLSAAGGDLNRAPLVIWIALALFMGGGVALSPALYRAAATNHLAWAYALTDEADLRRVHAWQRRWFNFRVITPASMLPALAVSLLIFWLLGREGAPLPLGSLYMGFLILALLMNNAVSMLLVVLEARQLAASKTELFAMGPTESLPVRQTLRGLTQLGAINVFLLTPGLLGLLLLLPSSSWLIVPAAIVLLLFEFTYTALAALVPRTILSGVVRRKKEAEVRRLQGLLNEMLPHIATLNMEERAALKSLQETYAAVLRSPENLLPLDVVLRTVGALLLSTVTVLLTASAQKWIGGILAQMGR